MLEINNQFGVVIDENAVNVGLVHKEHIDPAKYTPVYFGTEQYVGSDAATGIFIDIPIASHITKVIVGVEFRYGIGYSQITMKKGGRSTVRVYLALHKSIFLARYPKYAHLSKKSSSEILIEVLKQENISVLFFSAEPPIRNTGLGLEVFDRNGRLLFDSDLPTITFPLDLPSNADNYRSFIMIWGFCPLNLMTYTDYPPISMVVNDKGTPLLYMGGVLNGKLALGEMSAVIRRLTNSRDIATADNRWLRLVDSLQSEVNMRFILASY